MPEATSGFKEGRTETVVTARRRRRIGPKVLVLFMSKVGLHYMGYGIYNTNPKLQSRPITKWAEKIQNEQNKAQSSSNHLACTEAQ